MSFAKIQELLDVVRDYYRDFLSTVRQLETAEPRVAELTRRIAEAELQMQIAVDDLARHADGSILETWVQFTNETELEEKMEDVIQRLHRSIKADGSQCIDELLERYWEFNRCLAELYELVSHATDAPVVNEIFNRLTAIEKQNARDVAWAARSDA